MSTVNVAVKRVITDGDHTTEVLKVLKGEIASPDSLTSIVERARGIIERSVDPIAGPPEHPSDGLLYGLIQSGKTSIITVAAGMAADNGFQCIIILTSDIDLLYDQTLERVRKALRGLTVLGKNDWKDPPRFERQLRTFPFVIVCSKNASKLKSLIDAFKTAKAKGLSTLLIDDEADQASLNTYTNTGGDQISKINEAITELRQLFMVNTYLQVTATPQALFLQRPDHRYRPSFTVLSDPGPGYVGGDEFFGPDSKLLREVELDEVEHMLADHQPSPTSAVPTGLRRALYTFFVGATARIIQGPADSFAFLCHVSLNKRDHEHIVKLLDAFKEQTLRTLEKPSNSKYSKLVNDLRLAYEDLLETEPRLPDLNKIVGKIKFYLKGANIKLINATSNEEIKLDAAYNIFVGGNKLGRGVTIKNLLVSYYGRNPKRPNADTVLQHARMYGYREADLGITRLFLPKKLAEHFRIIHQMENALRELVKKYPEGKFEGIYISSPLRPTRQNVLDPNAIGMYVAGQGYNPSYPLRTVEVRKRTSRLDELLKSFDGASDGQEVTVDFLIDLVEQCVPDPAYGVDLWDTKTLKSALETLKARAGNRAYLVVRRGRKLSTHRRETQGIIAGGEELLAPKDAPTLFMYRVDGNARGEVEVWWPQLRFPEGNYVFAFSFEP